MTILLVLWKACWPLLSGLWSATWSLLQKPAVLVGLGIAVLVAAVWAEDHARSTANQRAKTAVAALAQARADEALKARQAAVSDQAALTDTAAQTGIQTVFRTLSEETPVYVPTKADADCVIPDGAVRLLDAGIAGVQLPDAAGPADAAPSPFHLSDLAANALANDAAKRANDQQLIDLQSWIRAQQAVAR